MAASARMTLVLADLAGTALLALGPNDGISASAGHTASLDWARAILAARPRWYGIRYVSRQMNEWFVLIVFERSRLRKSCVVKVKTRLVDDLCDRTSVTAV